MATGLNFQTQTIINSNLDPDSSKVNDDNKKNSYLFKAFNAEGEDPDNVDAKDNKKYKVNTLRVKRDFVFEKGCVKAIRKKAGYPAEMCKATINFGNETLLNNLKTGNTKTYCRLDIYLGVEGAEPYIYSTPWVQKGMPFWIEFTVNSNDSGKIVAENVANAIKKNHIFLCDKDLMTVTATNEGKLILEGATEYQRIRKIELSTFKADEEYAVKVAELDPLKEGATDIVLDQRGLNAFGTYSQIVKDLRLPTAANYQWSHIRQVETPIVGAIYDQYIIEYAAPATNDGMQCVGQRLESHTTHVFWVKHEEGENGLTKAWEDALKIVGTIEDNSINPSESRNIPEPNSSEEGGL